MPEKKYQPKQQQLSVTDGSGESEKKREREIDELLSETDHEEHHHHHKKIKKQQRHNGSDHHHHHSKHHHWKGTELSEGFEEEFEEEEDEYGGSYNGDEDTVSITKMSESLDSISTVPQSTDAPETEATAATTTMTVTPPASTPSSSSPPPPAMHSMSTKEIASLFIKNGTCTQEEALALESQLAGEKLDGRAMVRIWLFTTKHEFLLSTLQRIGIKAGIAATLVHLVASSVRHFSKGM